MKKKQIAIIFGGCSSEYIVSLASASAVITHLDQDRFSPVLVGISKQGCWYYYAGSVEKIADNTWENQDCIPACISPNRCCHELIVFHKNRIERIPIDAVLPVLHGKNGEDGTVQGLCELAGIPLIGCGTLSSALCMDKDRAHKLAFAAGVQVPESFVLTPDYDVQFVIERVQQIGYPIFVKPVKSGSSFGVAKIDSQEILQAAIEEAFRYDDRVIVEKMVPGFEVGCAVMGCEKLLCGEPDEIELEEGFFDYIEKYNLITSKIHVPARITKEKAMELKETAKIIYRALGCNGFARVDMFLTPEGEIVFNEVNTIPGFTAHSRFPNMMQAAGMTFEEIITRIIETAVET